MKQYRATILFDAEDDTDARVKGRAIAGPYTLTDIEVEASYWPSIPLEEPAPLEDVTL